MIQEITNFIDEIPESVFSYHLTLDEGLYIFVELDNNGNLTETETRLYKKDAELDSFFDRCLTLQTKVKPVAPSKIFNPIKKIFGGSCSGFALCFNKKNVYKDKILRSDEINVSLVEYFKGAEKYILQENENHVVWFSKFKLFCCNNLIAFLQDLPEYTSLKDNSSVNIFLNEPSIEDFQKLYDPYVANSVFNKDDYKTELERVIYNIADSLSSFSEKKMFWRHKTAPFEFNYKITGEQAKKIWQFFNIRGRVLPNPLPIFIDKKELNKDVIRVVNEDKKLSYSEIIKKIFPNNDNGADLGNYYLLFFQKGELVDLDFVPSYHYLIDDMFIFELFSIGGKQEKRITNLFEFESHVANRIFNGQLITKTNAGGWWLKYFGDIEYNPKYLSDNTYNQLLKYRKSFYDYIYKAKRESIQSFMFHDIMLKGILDDLRTDEYKDRNHTKDFSIKEKLNIWFSLFYYFDKNLNNTESMASRILEHQEKMRDLISGTYNLKENEDDDMFAFATGQVIYYLFSKSETSDRSYGRLEAFLQKKECGTLQATLFNTFNMYKHKPFSNNFRKPFAEVMDYKTSTNISTLMPTILAGFFSDNTLFADTND